MGALLERDLARILEAELGALGARWYHTHDSRRSAFGWPDYAVVIDSPRGSQLLFLELKKAGGSPTAEQVDWLRALAGAGQPAILAAGAAGVASAVELLRGIAKGRQLMPSALGRVVVFGDVSPAGLARLGGSAVDATTTPQPRTPDIRRRRRGW